MKTCLRPIGLVGGILYTLLFCLSLAYFKERTIFVDIAFHLFYILKDSDFAIQNHRWGAAMTQIVPLLMTKAGFDLKSIMVGYSVTFVFLQAVIFLLNLVVFRAPRWAMAVLIFSIGMTTHTFFWIQSEFQQGIPVMLLTFAYLTWLARRKRTELLHQAAIAFLVFSLCFFHPLILLLFLFLTGYFYLRRANRSLRQQLWFACSLFLAFHAVRFLFFKTSYDTQSMLGLAEIVHNALHVNELNAFRDIMYWLVADYFVLAVILFAVLAVYLARRRLGMLLYVFTSFSGYLVLICANYPASAPQFYMENLFLGLVVIAGIPFLWDVLPVVTRRYPRMVLSVALCLVLLRLGEITLAGRLYQDRLNWERSLLDETADYPVKKLLVNNALVPMDTLLMCWGTAYEFWLLSTLEDGKTRSIIIDDQPEQLLWALDEQQKFVTRWGVFPYGELPKRYFQFRDTSKYKYLPAASEGF